MSVAAKAYIFRVIRERVGDETVRVLLEPYLEDRPIALNDGDQFVTGYLNADPWPEPGGGS